MRGFRGRNKELSPDLGQVIGDCALFLELIWLIASSCIITRAKMYKLSGLG